LSIKRLLDLHFNPAVEKKSRFLSNGVGLLPNADQKLPQTSAYESKAHETATVMPGFAISRPRVVIDGRSQDGPWFGIQWSWAFRPLCRDAKKNPRPGFFSRA
jgi:hypothetical protein